MTQTFIQYNISSTHTVQVRGCHMVITAIITEYMQNVEAKLKYFFDDDGKGTVLRLYYWRKDSMKL